MYYPFWDLACYGPLCEEDWYNQYFTINGFSATVGEMGQCEETVSSNEAPIVQIDAVLSPNPILRHSGQMLSLAVSDEATALQLLTFTLFDASGGLVAELPGRKDDNFWQLNLSNVPLTAGVYWVRILGLQDSQPILRKLIVQ